MTHEAIQASYPKFEGNPVPPKSVMPRSPQFSFANGGLNLPEGFRKARSESTYFIGPRNISDEARGLMTHKVEGLAVMALKERVEFPDSYVTVEAEVAEAYREGYLLLDADYPSLTTTTERVTQFMVDTMQKSLESPDELLKATGVESTQSSTEPVSLEQFVIRSQRRILRSREPIIEDGMSDKVLREFDTLTRIRTVVETGSIPAVEAPAIPTRDIPLSFGRKALEMFKTAFLGNDDEIVRPATIEEARELLHL